MKCRAVAALALLALGACDEATVPREAREAPVQVSGVLTPAQQAIVAGMSVEVTGPGIGTAIVADLAVNGAQVNGTVTVPVGPSRTFTVRAYDATGIESYAGSATAGVAAGTNPPLTVRLAATSGSVPIDVTIGTYAVTLTPATASVAVNGEVTLTANVTASTGTPPTGALTWGVVNPTLVTLTVAQDGRSAVVRGRLAGTTRVVASYEGIASASEVTVTATTGNQPPVAVAGGPYVGINEDFVVFSAAGSRDPDGSIVSYQWNLGSNGRTATGANPAVRYRAGVGTYTVTLTVTDDRGATATATTTTTISAANAAQLGSSGQVVAGEDFSCALSGVPQAAWCWGGNAHGQLGNGTRNPSLYARRVTMPAGVTFTSLAVGASHACAFTTSGEAYCWGANQWGQLGVGDTVARLVPTLVPANARPSTIGAYHACGGLDGNTFRCWGRNDEGQITGSTTRAYYTSPEIQAVGIGLTYLRMVAGARHTCFYGTSNVSGIEQRFVNCRGGGAGARSVAIGSTTAVNGFYPAPLGEFTCHTWSPAAGVQCWGDNAWGAFATTPVGTNVGPLALPSGYQSLAFGAAHSCGMNNGTPSCAGDNRYGQLGTGSSSAFPQSYPAPIVGLSGPGFIGSFAGGARHTCGILSARVLCWGDNRIGQLGSFSEQQDAMPNYVWAVGQ